MHMSTIEVVHLNDSQIEDAASVLANAFQGDPLAKYMFPNPVERAKKMPLHFMPILRYGLLFGEVLTTDSLDGVAVWLPPGQWEVTPERAMQVGFDQLPALMGNEAVARFSQAIEYISTFHVRDAPDDHWYLMAVGIDSTKQGRGIGRALVEPILKQANEAGLPCYLETGEPTNAMFYTKLGFQQLVNEKEPASQLPFWTFRRDANIS